MKLTFVGSSHGVPEASRKCSCIMLEIGSDIYFFDMGTPVTEMLRRKNKDMANVKGVFISHMHGDHMDGLIDFLDLSTWYFKTCNPNVILPGLEVRDCINNYLNLLGISLRDEIKFTQTEAGVVFDNGSLKVTAIPTQHIKKSYAFLIEAQGKRILYTSDLKNPDIDFPHEALKAPLDMLICESAHFNPMGYLPHLKNADIKKVCINHYQPNRIPSILELAEKLENIPVVYATDELEFEF